MKRDIDFFLSPHLTTWSSRRQHIYTLHRSTNNTVNNSIRIKKCLKIDVSPQNEQSNSMNSTTCIQYTIRHCSHFLCIYANKAIWNTDQIEPYIWFVRKVNWIKFLRVGISRMKYVYNWIFHLSLKRPHAKCTREWNCYIWTIFSSVIPCTGTVSARRQVS